MVVPVGSDSVNAVNAKAHILKRAVQTLVKAQQEGLLKKAQMKKAKKKTQKQNKYKQQRAGKKMTPKQTKKSQTIPKVKKKKVKKKKHRSEVKGDTKKETKLEKIKEVIQDRMSDAQTERELLIMAKRIKAMSLRGLTPLLTPSTPTNSESKFTSAFEKDFFGFGWVDSSPTSAALTSLNSFSSLDQDSGVGGGGAPTNFFLAPSRLTTSSTSFSSSPPIRALKSEVTKSSSPIRKPTYPPLVAPTGGSS
jgi:hypothetical protein